MIHSEADREMGVTGVSPLTLALTPNYYSLLTPHTNAPYRVRLTPTLISDNGKHTNKYIHIFAIRLKRGIIKDIDKYMEVLKKWLM